MDSNYLTQSNGLVEVKKEPFLHLKCVHCHRGDCTSVLPKLCPWVEVEGYFVSFGSDI